MLIKKKLHIIIFPLALIITMITWGRQISMPIYEFSDKIAFHNENPKLIDKEDMILFIKKIISNQKGDANLQEIENQISKHPYTKKVDVYKKNDTIIAIDIVEHIPLAILNFKSKKKILTLDGKVLPYKNTFSKKLHIINIQFKDSDNMFYNICAYILKYMTNEDYGKEKKFRINTDSEYFNILMLVDKYTKRIKINRFQDIDKQLKKIKYFYKIFWEVEPKKYSRINLEFKKQIVAN